jgi:hypothetical protein
LSCSAGDEGADGSVSVTLVSDAPDRVDLVADGGRVTLETLLVRVAVGVVLMFPSLVGGVEGEGTSAIVVVVVVVVVAVVVVIIEQRGAQIPGSEPHPYPGLSPQ